MPLIDYQQYVDARLCAANQKMDRNMQDSKCSRAKAEKITIPKSNRPKTKKSRQKYKLR